MSYESIIDRLKNKQRFADGGSITAKRGLVDGPGGYAGNKLKTGPNKGKYVYVIGRGENYRTFYADSPEQGEAWVRENRLRSGWEKPQGKTLSKTELNKASQYFFQKNYDQLNADEKRTAYDRVRGAGRTKSGEAVFKVKTQLEPLSTTQQDKIKKAFPDTNFNFKKGQKLGVPLKIKGKRNPEYSAVESFVQRGYKKPDRDVLPVSVQKQITARFDLPKGIQEWDFEKYKYGIPDTGGKNMNLGKRIVNFVSDPKEFKIAADFGTPKGWMMTQMGRAFRNGNQNYIPTYKTMNGKKMIVGFTDNSEFGKGKTYFPTKKYAKEFGGTLMDQHLDFKNTQKYFDIAKRVHSSPNEAITKILTKGGIQNDRITLNSLLQYMINEKGVNKTDRALVLHHQSGAAIRPTGDYQLLNQLVNAKIKGVEADMRAGNITSQNIKFLKDAGATVVVNGKKYGGGPTTALGGFRAAENFVRGTLQGYTKADWKNLQRAFNTAKNVPGMTPSMKAFLGVSSITIGSALDKFIGTAEADTGLAKPVSADIGVPSVIAGSAMTSPLVRQGAAETISKTAKGIKDIYQKAKQVPGLGTGIKATEGTLGFLLKRVVPPVIVGMEGKHIVDRAAYERPGEFLGTIADTPFRIFTGTGPFEAIKEQKNLYDFVKSEEDKKVLDRIYTPQYESMGTSGYGEADYIPVSPSKEDLNRFEGIKGAYNRARFGTVGVDTADEVAYNLGEAQKTYAKRRALSEDLMRTDPLNLGFAPENNMTLEDLFYSVRKDEE